MLHFARAYLMMMYLSSRHATGVGGNPLLIDTEERDLALSALAYRLLRWLDRVVERARKPLAREAPSSAPAFPAGAKTAAR